MSDWSAFYDAVAERPPHDTLLGALDRFEAPGFAVDLGCGDGRDTVELLRRGWRVLALDGQAEAIRRLRERVDEHAAERLESRVARFEEARWPEADLVNSSFALPFCPPAYFDDLWRRVRGSIRLNGRFSGQLFGERDEWSGTRDITFHTRNDVDALLEGLELERFDEVEEDGQTATGGAKHWHVFHIVARRPI
ncbi:MAG TPA: class I SAM-dependent methyltransferase [Gaiellaceae bacterium]|nr:class I SAM-dependent methyltransferase [Gaiellaceae bacterium]